MKLLTFGSLGLSVLLLGLAQNPASAITIDVFSDVDDNDSGEQFVQDTSFGTISPPTSNGGVSDTDGSGTALTGVLGGVRTIEVEKITPNNSSSKPVSLLIDAGTNERASYSSADGIQGKFSITWNGDFGSGIDLTDDNGTEQLYFRIDVPTNDNGVTLNFTVSNGTTTSTLSRGVAAGTTGSVFFDYASFSNPSVLTEATSISLSSDTAPASLDFSVDFFGTAAQVPFEFSPTLGLLTSVGFFGSLEWNKRRKKGKFQLN
jgi:hypothetical protein